MYHCVYDDGEEVSYNNFQLQKLYDMKHGNVIIDDNYEQEESEVSEDNCLRNQKQQRGSRNCSVF